MSRLQAKPIQSQDRDSELQIGSDGSINSTPGPPISILGIRGIPGAHGGFETFAENFALYLVGRGWRVTVYCQEHSNDDQQSSVWESQWHGVRRVHIAVSNTNAPGTAWFDLKSAVHAAGEEGPVLVLGYNTAVLAPYIRLRGRPVIMNMDGIEWKRAKWSLPIRAWLYLNEYVGRFSASHLVADHPDIAAHLERHFLSQSLTMIPYASDTVIEGEAALLDELGVEPHRYLVSIARIEPENSIYEIVEAFSRRQRGIRLVVLGSLSPETNDYHKKVVEAASEEVAMPGAIYDRRTVSALRFFALAYCHGHTVGGTNPSLVEALGAGNVVIAHDNRFNRWVTDNSQLYFRNADDIEYYLDQVLGNASEMQKFAEMARAVHSERYTWEAVHRAYENLLLEYSAEAHQIP